MDENENNNEYKALKAHQFDLPRKPKQTKKTGKITKSGVFKARDTVKNRHL